MEEIIDLETAVPENYTETDLKNVELDLGLLCVSDNNTINQKKWKEDKDAYMMSEAHKAVKLILGKLAELPRKEYKSVDVVELPDPTTVLPRAMPPPKKFKTKWEEYADKKGIKKHKKEKKIYDEETKKWMPVHGAKSKNNKKDWLLEVPENAEDPNQDLFHKKKADKKERMAKNEYKRLQNIARAQKTEAAKLAPTRKDLKMALIKAREATASMGRFDPVMREEKNLPAKTAKRKLPADFGSVEKENDKMLEIFKNIQKKRPKLDNDRAANLQIQETMDENRQKSGNKKKKPNLTNISRHQKFGKHAKNHKKMGGKKAKAAAKHTF